MITYTIDPGKHESSVAVGTRGHGLCHISRLKADSSHDWNLPRHSDGPCKIILEVPRSYPATASRANDLIDEVVQGSLIAGRIAQATGGQIVIVHPNTATDTGRKGWKGQIVKPVHHQRILARLTPSELAILLHIKADVVQYVNAAVERYTKTRKVTGYKALIHNDLDAVGIFLEDCGRMK